MSIAPAGARSYSLGDMPARLSTDEWALFRRRRGIIARSRVRVLGPGRAEGEQIGAELGDWPVFADCAEGFAAVGA